MPYAAVGSVNAVAVKTLRTIDVVKSMQNAQINSGYRQVLDAILPPRHGAFEALLSRILPPREYHLPGQHDQCDHSVTGECVEEEPAGERRELFRAERRIALDQHRETAVAFNEKGEMLLNKQGEKSSVFFHATEIAKVKNAVFTHNHPSGRGLSIEDLNFAEQADLREMRAVGDNEHGKFTFIIKRPKDGWPNDMMFKTSEWNKKLRARLVPLVEAGRISDRQAGNAHHFALMALVAKDIGAEHRVVRIRPKKQ